MTRRSRSPVAHGGNPGTIAYVGYGSLIERGADPFRATARGLLFKVSYLKRL